MMNTFVRRRTASCRDLYLGIDIVRNDRRISAVARETDTAGPGESTDAHRIDGISQRTLWPRIGKPFPSPPPSSLSSLTRSLTPLLQNHVLRA